MKNKEFDILQGVLNLFISKIKIFSPFLQHCQILQNWVTRQNERLEKNWRHIRFQNKKLHFLNSNYYFLEAKALLKLNTVLVFVSDFFLRPLV